MHRLACNLYLWSRDAQDRFLQDFLAPIVHDWITAQVIDGFFFDRFDARGPHLFFILSLDKRHLGLVESELKTLLDASLGTAKPQTPPLTQDELEERHRACRGKALCALDRLDGFAPQGSYEVFLHPLWGYPFAHGKHLDDDASLPPGSPWRDWTEITLWAIELLGSPLLAQTLEWLTAVDRCMTPEQAADFWRHALHRLLPDLPMLNHLESVDPSMVKRFVGEEGFALLGRLWGADRIRVPDPTHLVAAGLLPSPRGQGWELLREIVFVTLKQLGIKIRRQARIYAFALDRRLEELAATCQRGH